MARRDALRLFGLTAAGVAVGAYAAPAMASFRPPAAFIGSSIVTFVPEGQRTLACDGPACDMAAGALFSLNSISFRGKVHLALEPTTPTSGWILGLDKQAVQLKPGAQVFVSTTLDCYHDPQVGAEPETVHVRVTATAFPADGSPSFVINTLPAQATSVRSSLTMSAPASTVVATPGTPTNVTVVVNGEHIDSSVFGPVQIKARVSPNTCQVVLPVEQLSFAGSASFPVQANVRIPSLSAGGTAVLRIEASLDHPSFAEPMVAEQLVTITHGP